MATLCHLPMFSPFSVPNKLFPSPKQPSQLTSGARRYPCRRTFGISASSSSRRPRNGRKVKSNEELCSEIKQFMSLIGLPEGHVPSMKELSEHGRKDLAHIVRRRGYKLIKELLATSSREDNNGFHGEKSIAESHGPVLYSGDMSAGQDENGSNAITIPEVLLSIDVGSFANEFLNASINSDDQSSMKESTANSLVEQDEMGNTMKLKESDELHSVKESGEHTQEEESDLKDQSSDGYQEGGITMKYEDTIQSRMSSVKEAIGGTALTPSETIVMPGVVPPEAANNASQSHSAIEGEQLRSYDAENYLSTKEESQIELDRLRSMVKELELSRLRELIEKETSALSAMQTKAEAEIRKAQKLVSEKDAELDDVEESLSELKEVNIQYAGEGEIVEVAGSFNGWHHQITLDLQPSSPETELVDLRKPGLWSALLWLYPGTYEIKFIIDGHWKIDPQKESITRNGISNNILRVDR